MPEIRTREAIAADYQEARAGRDSTAMARCQNEEACLVLLAMLARLAGNTGSFVHRVAVKGGILMAGELGSPRVSADIDMTSGLQKRVNAVSVVAELREAGREFNVRLDGEPERTPGGTVIHLRFDSLTDAGTAKVEISIRENLVFAIRDAQFDVTSIGIDPFALPALAEVELVAEKLRALTQRAQPRDLFDLHLYLTASGWFLDQAQLLQAADAKLTRTKHGRWRRGLWRSHLAEIEPIYEATLLEWVPPERLPPFADSVREVERRLRELRLE